jgi:hypothetical protein
MKKNTFKLIAVALIVPAFIVVAIVAACSKKSGGNPDTVVIMGIEGRFTYSDDGKMILDITKSNDEYSYRLRVNSQTYSGKVTVHDNTSITLEDIPVKQYEYKLINGERTNVESDPSYGPFLMYENGVLNFQNRGDPMAYYVIFDDCTEKFVTLTKETPQPPIQMEIVDKDNPIALANWAFELIMQMEGRDDYDLAVAEELNMIQSEIVPELPESNRRLFSAELEKLYTGIFNLEHFAITIYGINSYITDEAAIWVVVANERGMLFKVAMGEGKISSGRLTVNLTISDEFGMLDNPERYPQEKDSFYITMHPILDGKPDTMSEYSLIYGNYDPVAFDIGILELDFDKFQ